MANKKLHTIKFPTLPDIYTVPQTANELPLTDSDSTTVLTELNKKVNKTTTVNGKALSSNVVLDASNINIDETAAEKKTVAAELASQSSQIDQLMPLRIGKDQNNKFCYIEEVEEDE